MAKRKTAKKKTEIISGLFVLIVALIFIVHSHFSSTETVDTVTHNGSNMVITAIDIGQGDSILITQGEHSALIDAGPGDSQDKLIEYLKNQNIQKFDYVIATHPHEDHIGGMDKVVEEFEIDNFIMTELPDKMIPSTKVYQKMVEALLDKNVNVIAAESGQSYKVGDVKLDILTPVTLNYDDLNNFSVVTRVSYGETVAILTGDAEKEVEEDLLKSGENLRCDIYKVGHHGSETSSSEEFLSAMHPTYAVISCAEDNSYNHPHTETVKNLSKYGIKYYVTKDCGAVSFVCDGKNVAIHTEKEISQ